MGRRSFTYKKYIIILYYIMKIGLYFGSFNPIHIGHLIIANYVINYTDVKQVWFVISPQNPFKRSGSLLNEYHRLHMVNSALYGEARLRPSNIEFNLPKPSYTVDSLAYLKDKYPENEFSILMGSDSFQNLNKWKNYEVIIKNYPIYIYKRPGFDIPNAHNASTHILDAPLLNISSTLIRDMVKSKKSIRFLVPDVVREEIETAGYYK